MLKNTVKLFLNSIVIVSFLSAPVYAEPTCDDVIKAFEHEVATKDNVIEAQLRYADLLEKQRDKAYDLAAKGATKPIPWYMWILVGAGAGVATMCVAGGCK